MTDTDLGDREHAESSLRELNRKLRAISNCNQVLLRAEEEQTLLDEICRIICEEAGYLLAWVGYAEHDAQRTIRPAAWAGRDSGYIARARLSWSEDTERGRGPAGLAIRSGATIQIQDIGPDARMKPWREQALERGYRAVMGLPLKDSHEEVFGVLLVYHGTSNAFSRDEVELMEGLAGNLAYGITALRDRAVRSHAERALREQQELLLETQRIAHIGFWDRDISGDRITLAVEACRILGISDRETVFDLEEWRKRWAALVHPGDRRRADRALAAAERGGPRYSEEYRVIRPDGEMRRVHSEANAVLDGSGRVVRMRGMLQDVTERKRLEEQLRQAQRLDTVGSLAGGVAHDFNNMLSVILGSAEMALRKLPPSDPLLGYLKEIVRAAERSSDLTRQLLAFARKQVITPRVIDLNETLAGMLKMLRRLIGEDVDLEWLPEQGALPVNMDPTQIDQILVNLCINARDAIVADGRITIGTHRSILDARSCAERPGSRPGAYAMLEVRDDGRGMDRAISDRIFEPFFTTKEIGRGTGLGLSTVYGIVKQNDGFINVRSEPGKGTSFEIGFPLHERPAVERNGNGGSATMVRGNETVLLVEDEPGILEVVGQMLEICGYRVLSAATPAEAIRAAEAAAGGIDLLITDVVMPGMNGRELARRIGEHHPRAGCLYMSGYTTDVIARHGVLEKGVHFIQKPFSMDEFAIRVREILNARAESDPER